MQCHICISNNVEYSKFHHGSNTVNLSDSCNAVKKIVAYGLSCQLKISISMTWQITVFGSLNVSGS